MNAQIQKLADKAGLFVDLSGESWPRAMAAEESVIVYQKFAELIVQECISIVESMEPGYKDYRDQIEDAFRRDCIAEIKHKFRVEE